MIFFTRYLCFFLFILIYTHQTCVAQHRNRNSDVQPATEKTEDTARVNDMIRLSEKLYWTGDYNESLKTASRAKDLSVNLNFKTGIGKALVISGQIYIRKGEYDSALHLLHWAVSIFEQLPALSDKAVSHLYLGQVYDYKAQYDSALTEYNIGLNLLKHTADEKTRVKFFNSLGITHFNKGSYETALEYYLKGVKISGRLDDDKLHAFLCNNIGAVYIRLSQYEDALKYFLLYHDVVKKLDAKHGMAVGFLNIGETYKHLGKYKEALRYLNEALRIQEELKDKRGLALSYSNLGDIYKSLNAPEKAKLYYNESLILARFIKNEEVLLHPLEGLGDLCIINKEFNKAQQYIEEARVASKKIGSKLWMERTYLSSSKLDSARGDFKRAYEWFKKYSSLNDSLFNERKSQQIIRMQELYESERKDKEIKLLNEANKITQLERVNSRRIFIISIIFLVLIILGMICWLIFKARNSKILKDQKEKIFRANNELKDLLDRIEYQNGTLAQKNESLEELHREKDGLIGIVAHDLRSPLNRISGLSNLISLCGELNSEQKLMIENINKVCRDGNDLIQNLLDINQYETVHNPNFKSIELIDFMALLLNHYNPLVEAKALNLYYYELAEKVWMTTDEDFLTRILDNLITNAIKFSTRGSAIYVDVVLLSQEFVKIIVRDEGPGFSSEDLLHLFKKFKKLSAKPTGGESSTGLGLSIVKLLVNKLNGSIEVESEPGKGASFIVHLPLNLIPAGQIKEYSITE